MQTEGIVIMCGIMPLTHVNQWRGGEGKARCLWRWFHHRHQHTKFDTLWWLADLLSGPKPESTVTGRKRRILAGEFRSAWVIPHLGGCNFLFVPRQVTRRKSSLSRPRQLWDLASGVDIGITGMIDHTIDCTTIHYIFFSTIIRLYRGKENWVSTWAARNHECKHHLSALAHFCEEGDGRKSKQALRCRAGWGGTGELKLKLKLGNAKCIFSDKGGEKGRKGEGGGRGRSKQRVEISERV